MSDNSLISVIVPVYNVEPYLTKCIDSIISQTYKNIEIILVDDGSTDHSGEICDRYTKTDCRIRALHKLNGGLSSARNVGIDAALGEFICFFDSDDWVEPNIIKASYNTIIKDQTDIVIWGVQKDYLDKNGSLIKTESVVLEDAICNRSEKQYQPLLSEAGLAIIGYAWNKLYRTALLHNNKVKFEEGTSLVEDIIFNQTAFIYANSISFLKIVGNHYNQRIRETLGAKFYHNYYDLKIRACKSREMILAAYGASPKEIKQAMDSIYFSAIKSACRMVCKSKNITRRGKSIYMRKICSTKQALETIKTASLHGKDKIFRIIFKLKQYWIFEVLYKA